MSELAELLQTIHPLPEEVLAAAAPHFVHQEYPKQAYLLRTGRICQHIWWLTTGAVRYFYTDPQGKEVNVWFSFEHEPVADTPGLLQQTPSEECIQALEATTAYALAYPALQHLIREHHAFAIWYIRLLEKHYVVPIEERLVDLQFLTARERYEKLVARVPNILNRVSLGHIASFLNITPETLSRIRAGKL